MKRAKFHSHLKSLQSSIAISSSTEITEQKKKKQVNKYYCYSHEDQRLFSLPIFPFSFIAVNRA